MPDTNKPNPKLITRIDILIEKGDVQSGKRGHDQANALLPDFLGKVGLNQGDETRKIDEDVRTQSIRFILDVILPISWYARKIDEAWTRRNWYLWASGALLLIIPLVLSSVSFLPKGSVGEAPIVVGQLTGLLTGVVALQRLISTALAQQQRYGAWYKASADLKKLWYGFQSSWLNKGLAKDWPAQQVAFIADLGDRVVQGRAIMSDEQADFFQKLTLPTVDLTDYLSKARADVGGVLGNLAPGAASATAQASELLKARQDFEKQTNLIKGYLADIDTRQKELDSDEMKKLADTDPIKGAVKNGLAELKKELDAASLAKRKAEANVAAFQVT
jgi:hypothetical protein